MKPVVTITFIFYFGFAFSQNRITHYEYWFNEHIASKQKVNITATSAVQFSGSFSTPSLADGLNYFHIRFGDDSGRYSIPVSQYFYKRTAGTNAAARINAYQYWIDNQHGSAVLQTVSPVSLINLNAAIDLKTLSAGLHLFHIRFRDNTNMWSSPATHYVYKPPAYVSSGPNGIVAMQYWIDGDLQNAVTKTFTTGTVLQLTEALPIHTYAGGIHMFNFRLKDAIGQWSAVQSHFVYIPPSYGGSAANGLSKMQYWFDDDVSKAIEIQLTGEAVVSLDESIITTGLKDGIHLHHVRFKDTMGHWSTTISSFVYKFSNNTITNNVITGYRYWFNDFGSGEMVAHTLPNQQALTLNTVIDMGCLTAGVNRIHVQFQDKKGLWSTGTTDTLTVQLPPSNIYRFTGSGNWSNASNWLNNNAPAPDVPGCKEVIIDHAPGGSCYLDVPTTILKNSKITVMPGKHLVLPQHLRIKN